MAAIHRAVQLVTQAQMVVEVEVMATAQMAELSRETGNPCIGRQVRRRRWHGDSLQTMEEVILTACAQNRRTTWTSLRSVSSELHSILWEITPFSRSLTTSPLAW